MCIYINIYIYIYMYIYMHMQIRNIGTLYTHICNTAASAMYPPHPQPDTIHPTPYTSKDRKSVV